jgi:hypothetical protein
MLLSAGLIVEDKSKSKREFVQFGTSRLGGFTQHLTYVFKPCVKVVFLISAAKITRNGNSALSAWLNPRH